MSNADNLKLLKDAIAAGTLSHTRQGDGCWRNVIFCYVRDAESPSGVHLLCGVDDTPEASALLRGALSPLSPTEGWRAA